MNKLSKTIAGIFVLLATAFTAAFGQSSGLPSGVTPLVHLKANDVLTYEWEGGPYAAIWKDNISGHPFRSSGYGIDSASPGGIPEMKDRDNYSFRRLKYSDSYTGFTSNNYRVTTPLPLPLTKGISIFVVMGEDYYRFSLSCSERNNYSIASNSGNEGISFPYGSSGSVYEYNNYTQYPLVRKMASNGRVLISASMENYSYNTGYPGSMGFSADKADIYEIFVFDHLTEFQRIQVEEYLLNKYNIERSDIPKTGMTLWMKGNNGVTTNTSGNVTNIKDHSPLNNTFSGNKLTAGNNTVYWDGWNSYGWFNSSSLLINGYAAEFFAVVYSKDNQYFDRPMFTFSGASFYQSTLSCYSSGGTTIKENFGLPAGQSVQMADTAAIPLENNFQLYNVSVGDTVWQAYLNRTLLRNMSVPSTSMNVNRFGFGTVGTGSSYSSKGGISEVIVYNRKLSNTEREIVRNYLMAKYGLN